MKCPHCSVHIHEAFSESPVTTHGAVAPVGKLFWHAISMTCPQCHGAIILLRGSERSGYASVPTHIVFPQTTGRQSAAPEVPAHIAEDFHEACAVLRASPKASAALSRRCLQSILREQGFTQKDLAPAIQAALDSKQIPVAIAENLDAIRNIGNFAAHPLKDSNTGEILPVVPEEADWNLDVLEELFDFFYVQPEKARQKRAALNAKLVAAGKPEMK